MVTVDNETLFISSLLRASGNEQEDFFNKQIPLKLFSLHESKMAWLYEYREKYGKYPSPQFFQKKFNFDLPKTKDAPVEVLQTIIDIHAVKQMETIVANASKRLAEGKAQLALSTFRAEAEKLNSFNIACTDVDFGQTSSSLHRYRELVRTKTLDSNSLPDTPWKSLNKLIKFYRPGETIIKAARTSIGKTWIILKLAHYWASKDIKTLLVSKEMSTDAISDRLEAIEFKLPYDLVRGGELSPKALRAWAKQRKITRQLPLIVTGDETVEGVGMGHIVSKINKYKPNVVIIDGAYLISPEGLSRNASQPEKFGAISAAAKRIAKATKTTIVLVLQMNRKAEKKNGETKGGIGDIYGSDTWAQDADFVYDISGKRGSNQRRITLLKGRESAIGEFTIGFSLDPFPDFPEIQGVASTNASGTQTFKAMA